LFDKEIEFGLGSQYHVKLKLALPFPMLNWMTERRENPLLLSCHSLVAKLGAREEAIFIIGALEIPLEETYG
jgi:hypothetical protein